MNTPVVLVASVALSAGAAYIVVRSTVHEAPPAVQDPGLRTPEPGEKIAALEQAVRELEARVRAFDPAAMRRAEPVIDEEKLAAAVAARLALKAGKAEREVGSGKPVNAATAAEGPKTVAEFRQLLLDRSTDFNASNALWSKAKALGLDDALLASFIERAKNEPNDPSAHVELGHAYISKMFVTTEDGPAKWALPANADKAYDRALQLDDHNWDARFSKAVSLANWPAFLGKGPDAIKNLEVLVDQQRTSPQRPEFAQTYLILGNLYDQQGNHEKALKLWQQGLSAFPDHAELKGKIR